MTATATRPIQPTGCTDADVRHYLEQGYLVMPDLVSPSEIAAIRQDLVHLARGGYPSQALQPMDATLSDDAVLERLLCIHQPHYISPVMRGFVTHPGIAAVLGRITGAHLAPGWWDGAVKCMQSMLFVKPPGKPGQAWHQDEVYIPTRDRSLVGAWIAVDDATVANGCLWVLPGSHRPGYLYPQRDHGRPDEFDFAPESHGFDQSAEVPVEVRNGTVVFFNGYLLHRSRRNRSGIYRRSLVNHYMTASSLLPWSKAEERLRVPNSGTRIATADYRGIVPVCGTDPYAWKGLEPVAQDVWLRTYDAAAIAAPPA